MKKSYYRALSIMIIVILLFSTYNVFASDPPEPPGGGHGQGGDLPPGGSAPVGSGTFLLLAFSTLYAVKKVYNLKNKIPNETNM